MRTRVFGCTLLVLVCFLSGGWPDQPKVAVAYVDADYDGIDDNLEMSLATQFLPTIWFSYADSCPMPFQRKAVFRARHPSVWGARNFNVIVINYVLLYDEDCAGPPILGPHPGDNEPFEVWLIGGGSSWQFLGVSATAHYDTMFEKRTMSYSNTIWVGNSKHANYADPGQCGIPWTGADECHSNYTLIHDLFNAGEPYAPLLSGMSQVYGPWSSEGVWYDHDNKFFGAGSVRKQLAHNRFISVMMPPGYWPCTDQCSAQLSACINSNPDPYVCYAQHSECTSSCWYYNSWDDEHREYGGGGPPPPPPGSVNFYEDIHSGGASFSAGADLSFVGWDWNDRISSIAIPSGKTVVLYQHIDYGGESITLTSSVSDLRDVGSLGYGWWNDQVSSIRIY